MRPLIGITLGDPAGIGPEITDTIMLKGVVSRKKQLVPTLVSVLQQ